MAYKLRSAEFKYMLNVRQNSKINTLEILQTLHKTQDQLTFSMGEMDGDTHLSGKWGIHGTSNMILRNMNVSPNR